MECLEKETKETIKDIIRELKNEVTTNEAVRMADSILNIILSIPNCSYVPPSPPPAEEESERETGFPQTSPMEMAKKWEKIEVGHKKERKKRSPYNMFMSECMRKLTNMPVTERMKLCAREWKEIKKSL